MLSSTEFNLLSQTVKERKIKSVADLLILINKDFTGNPVSNALSDTKSGLKAGVVKITEQNGTNETRIREKKLGFKVRHESESQLADEIRVKGRK